MQAMSPPQEITCNFSQGPVTIAQDGRLFITCHDNIATVLGNAPFGVMGCGEMIAPGECYN